MDRNDRIIELLEQIAQNTNAVNVKTDKMLLAMKALTEKAEGILN